MKISLSVPKTVFFTFALLCLLSAAFAQAQDKFDYDAERKRAFQLVEENKFPDALPVLEKLAAAKPDDAGVLERLSLSLIALAGTSKKSPELVRNDLVRARALAEKSRQLGNDSQIIEMILEKIPANIPNFPLDEPKKQSPAEEALMDAEADFSKGNLEKALAGYEKAAQLDPKLYEAPLYIGDVYFKMNKIEQAGAAYARAIAINPDRETAYRYWGNVLSGAGKKMEARDKFIEAIIAEPYSRAPWQFLMGWAQRNQVELGHPRIDIPKSSVQKKDDKNINILINPSDKKDGTDAWSIYSIVKAGWLMDKKFKEAFPDEKEYRHSLQEEAQALRLTAESVDTQLKKNELKENALDISIANLLKLHRAGLIEAYVLLAIPDESVARDYEKYRKDNRAKLRQYLVEFVVANK